MPRFDLYLTDEDDKLLRAAALERKISRSALLRSLLHGEIHLAAPK